MDADPGKLPTFEPTGDVRVPQPRELFYAEGVLHVAQFSVSYGKFPIYRRVTRPAAGDGAPKRRIIDGKFHVEGSKIIKTASGEVVPEDEALLLVRGRDRLAVPMLYEYRKLCQLDGCNDYQLGKVNEIIARFEEYARTHPTKQPGVTRGAVWVPGVNDTPAEPKRCGGKPGEPWCIADLHSHRFGTPTDATWPCCECPGCENCAPTSPVKGEVEVLRALSTAPESRVVVVVTIGRNLAQRAHDGDPHAMQSVGALVHIALGESLSRPEGERGGIHSDRSCESCGAEEGIGYTKDDVPLCNSCADDLSSEVKVPLPRTKVVTLDGFASVPGRVSVVEADLDALQSEVVRLRARVAELERVVEAARKVRDEAVAKVAGAVYVHPISAQAACDLDYALRALDGGSR